MTDKTEGSHKTLVSGEISHKGGGKSVPLRLKNNCVYNKILGNMEKEINRLDHILAGPAARYQRNYKEA